MDETSPLFRSFKQCANIQKFVESSVNHRFNSKKQLLNNNNNNSVKTENIIENKVDSFFRRRREWSDLFSFSGMEQ